MPVTNQVGAHARSGLIRIRMLGGFEAERPDRSLLDGLGRRTIALLACLAISEAPWTRDDLAALLWPGRRSEQARASLRQELVRLRRALEWDVNGSGGNGGSLVLPDGLADIDVVAFQRAAEDPHSTAKAVALYRGELLQGFGLGTKGPFTDWLRLQRRRLHGIALEVMLRLLRSPEGSEALARRIVTLEGTCEEAHRFLIRHHARRGDLGQVLGQFRACADALRTELGTEPSAATRELLDEVTLDLGIRPARLPAARSAAAIDWIRHAPDRAPVPSAPEAQVLAMVEDRPSLAVLPFANLSHDPLASSVLADGMMEEVTNALAHMPGFFVTARQSALAYQGLRLDARRIAAELGVRYLVEGSVEQDGRRMRANVRLIEGRTGQHLWAESQGGLLRDVMAVRDGVVQRIAGRLQPRLMLEEIGLALRRPPQKLDAWTWLQRANGVLLPGRHPVALEQVLDPLRRALEVDPRYPMAHALLSAVYTWRAVVQISPDPQEERRLAREHAGAALAADPDNPFVLAHCAETAIYSAADIDGAVALLELAVQRDPNDANGLATLAHARRFAGEDPKGSLALIDQALRLSPRDPRTCGWHHYANWCHFRLGDLDAMEASCRRSIELYGRYPMSWIGLTSALGLKSRLAEAQESAVVLRRLRPSFTPEGFYETARYFYGRRFTGAVEQEYRDIRAALLRAWG